MSLQAHRGALLYFTADPGAAEADAALAAGHCV